MYLFEIICFSYYCQLFEDILSAGVCFVELMRYYNIRMVLGIYYTIRVHL